MLITIYKLKPFAKGIPICIFLGLLYDRSPYANRDQQRSPYAFFAYGDLVTTSPYAYNNHMQKVSD
jgi:hypothetical protein